LIGHYATNRNQTPICRPRSAGKQGVVAQQKHLAGTAAHGSQPRRQDSDIASHGAWLHRINQGSEVITVTELIGMQGHVTVAGKQ
jgi:hypothetical protein